MNRHYDIKNLTDYFLGILPDEEENAVQQHLCECDECRRKVEQLRALRDGFFEEQEPAQIHRPVIIRVLRSHIFQAAAAVILVCGIGLLLFRNASDRNNIYQDQHILHNGRTMDNEVFAVDTFDRDDSIYYEEEYGPEFYTE